MYAVYGEVQEHCLPPGKIQRRHPAIIKWCLHLKFISSSACHASQESGIVTLTSERTLRDYTHWMPTKVGFMSGVDTQLVKEANISEEKNHYIVLCWDEINFNEHLVFDKHTCELVGFTDLGESPRLSPRAV